MCSTGNGASKKPAFPLVENRETIGSYAWVEGFLPGSSMEPLLHEARDRERIHKIAPAGKSHGFFIARVGPVFMDVFCAAKRKEERRVPDTILFHSISFILSPHRLQSQYLDGHRHVQYIPQVEKRGVHPDVDAPDCTGGSVSSA